MSSFAFWPSLCLLISRIQFARSACTASAAIHPEVCEGNTACNAAQVNFGNVITIGFYIFNNCFLDNPGNPVTSQIVANSVMEVVLSCGDGSCTTFEPGYLKVLPDSWNSSSDYPSTFSAGKTENCRYSDFCGNITFTGVFPLPADSLQWNYIGTLSAEAVFSTDAFVARDRVYVRGKLGPQAVLIDDGRCVADTTVGAAGSTPVIFSYIPWTPITETTTTITTTTTPVGGWPTTCPVAPAFGPDSYFFHGWFKGNCEKHTPNATKFCPFPMEYRIIWENSISFTGACKAAFLQACSAALPMNHAKCLNVCHRSIVIENVGNAGPLASRLGVLNAVGWQELINIGANCVNPGETFTTTTRTITRTDTTTTTTIASVVNNDWMYLWYYRTTTVAASSSAAECQYDDDEIAAEVLLVIVGATICCIGFCWSIVCMMICGRYEDSHGENVDHFDSQAEERARLEAEIRAALKELAEVEAALAAKRYDESLKSLKTSSSQEKDVLKEKAAVPLQSRQLPLQNPEYTQLGVLHTGNQPAAGAPVMSSSGIMLNSHVPERSLDGPATDSNRVIPEEPVKELPDSQIQATNPSTAAPSAGDPTLAQTTIVN